MNTKAFIESIDFSQECARSVPFTTGPLAVCRRCVDLFIAAREIHLVIIKQRTFE